ncbi:MAG: Asparagine synthetase [glutamine-hydrolyzing] [uncultured Rubrobacteraceae bacterium]|uniref:asparagine synthase (glutamine-hydrolyzing) n=1 Tax=uncultured Rubrobacteraceae bacterium TaxID=349277 RepID=A0A6J4RI04_9ACTN|nr:MAG: Asparagine synthetase [glutamine-hydrolyzing] [uncultured Rubrobacteraceae bacterium]
MCGIVAQHGRLDPEEAERMLSRLTHRGPDDEGKTRIGESWLGHRRLSIVDVSGGKQPLRTGRGALSLVGNGEVYNHEEIRHTLSGVSFSTSSDNEVALHLVAERGPDALKELLGMYAFVLAGKDGSFVAARDPVGIKPLYWASRDGRTVFASELGAFDEDWLGDVEAFPPGCYWTPEGGLERFRSAVPGKDEALNRFDGPSEPGAPIPDEMLALVRERLVKTVERQMMGDVPVGVFLSGGLDSSLVAAIAARWYEGRGEKLKTFAVGLEGSSDLLAARAVAEHLGTEHHESIYTAEEALEVLPKVVRCIESFDPSLVRSAVPNYLLARFTAEHVKVVLTGEGADEIFAGYEYLTEFATEGELHDELVRTIEGLHNLNLQRCDRVTMAHGLEARVPFLELDMIELGLSLPAGWKLSGPGQPEKRLLRQAFDGWLPEDFLWRKKEQFGDGSGASSVLKEQMEGTVTEEEFEGEKDAIKPALRTREEVAYYRIFHDYLGPVRPGAVLGRFATA